MNFFRLYKKDLFAKLKH